VVGLVLPWLVGGGAARILEAGRTRDRPVDRVGLLVFFGLPILALIALVTIVGIPLGIGLARLPTVPVRPVVQAVHPCLDNR
jgi:hypothetical protein